MATHDSRGYCYRCKIMHDEWICPYEVQDCQYCGEEGHSANECQMKHTADMGRRGSLGLRDETSRVSGPHYSSRGSSRTPATSDELPSLVGFDMNFLEGFGQSQGYRQASRTPSLHSRDEGCNNSFYNPIMISDSSDHSAIIWGNGAASQTPSLNGQEEGYNPYYPVMVSDSPSHDATEWASGPASLIYPQDSLESAEVPPKPKLVVPAPRSCGNRWTFWSSSSSKKTRS
jgi:hypothetical protein